MSGDEDAVKRGHLSMFVRDHPVALFFILAYLLSWSAWLVPALGYGGTLGLVGLSAGVFGPAVAAAIITWYSGRSVREWARSITHWRVPPQWYLIVLGVPVLLIGISIFGLSTLGLEIDLTILPGRLPMYIPTLVLTALLQGGNEEPGWRGFALPRLEERYPPVVATLILGIVWAFWHLPILLANPAETQHGMSLATLMPIILVTVVNIISLAFVYTWVYNSTRSVLLCILMHASFNTANALLIPLPEAALQGDVYRMVLLMTTGINLVVAAAIAVITRGRLGYDAAFKT